MSGIVQIELGARILIPHQDDSGGRQNLFHAEGYAAARQPPRICGTTLDASLKMLEQPAPNPVGASKLN